MSGINRNILGNYSQPVLSANQLLLSNPTTGGSRWVMLDFPILSLVSASQGGDCTGITLEWTPDSSFSSEPSSSYYAVTSSVISCDAQSLSPLTSSLGWKQFINSSYNTGSVSKYYIRAYQNVSGGGRGPYSNVVSVETRANKIYNSNVQSMGLLTGSNGNPNPIFYKAGYTGSVVILNTDSFNPTSSNLQAWSGDSIRGNGSSYPLATTNMNVTASLTGSTPNLIKNGGPNYDAIATNGATWSFQLYGSPSGSGREYNGINSGVDVIQPTASIAFVAVSTGSVQIVGNGGFEMTVYATTSSVKYFNTSSGKYDKQNAVTVANGTYVMDAGYNTTSRPVGIETNFFRIANGAGTDYTNVGTGSAGNLGSQITINTSNDCVLTALSLGVRYDVGQFVNQYGPYTP